MIGCRSDLDVSTVVASRRELDASERDWTFEGDSDGGLLHAVLSVEPWGPWDGPAAEVPFYWRTDTQTVSQTHI